MLLCTFIRTDDADVNYRAQLIGAWTLRHWHMQYSNRSEILYPFGENPQGLLIYSDDGWMNASICRADRQFLPVDIHPKHMAPEHPAAAFASFFQYAGPFRVNGDTVIHKVSLSLNPNLVGTQQVRHMEFSEGCLHLRGIEEANSETRTHTLEWIRASTD